MPRLSWPPNEMQISCRPSRRRPHTYVPQRAPGALRPSGTPRPTRPLACICGSGRNLDGAVTAPPPEPACGQECHARRIEAWLYDGSDSHDPPERRVVTP